MQGARERERDCRRNYSWWKVSLKGSVAGQCTPPLFGKLNLSVWTCARAVFGRLWGSHSSGWPHYFTVQLISVVGPAYGVVSGTNAPKNLTDAAPCRHTASMERGAEVSTRTRRGTQADTVGTQSGLSRDSVGTTVGTTVGTCFLRTNLPTHAF